MSSEDNDIGVITALVQRFENQRLPRAKRLHQQVMQGEKLTESDVIFLEDVVATINDIQPLLDKHPEYQQLATKAMSLYKEITEKALANEQTGS